MPHPDSVSLPTGSVPYIATRTRPLFTARTARKRGSDRCQSSSSANQPKVPHVQFVVVKMSSCPDVAATANVPASRITSPTTSTVVDLRLRSSNAAATMPTIVYTTHVTAEPYTAAEG